jgi:hypothetical protein
MKLQDLGARRPTEQIAKVLESQHGARIDFDRLSRQQARTMLGKVRSLVKEHRDSVSFHYSERNPDYMKLVMVEQALVSKLNEQPTVGGVAPVAGANQPGAAGSAAAVNPAQMGMQMAQRKKQLQDQLKAAQEQVRNIQKQITQPTLGMAESRRRISESEVQQAQVVLAAQDMVDQIQKMMEQISEMQFKDLPALVNSIRNDMGIDQATKYQADSTAALTTLLTSIQSGKTQLEAAQGILTGQAPVIPGVDAGIDASADLDAVDGDAGADIDADLSVDATLPADDEEDLDTPAAALGRERR